MGRQMRQPLDHVQTKVSSTLSPQLHQLPSHITCITADLLGCLKKPLFYFNVALLLFWFQIIIETTKKKIKAQALLHQVPLGPPQNQIFRQILLYKIPTFLPIFLKVS